MSDFDSNGHTRSGPRGLMWTALGALVLGAGGFLFHGANAGREALKEVNRQERMLERMDMNIVELLWHNGIKPVTHEEAALRAASRKSAEKKP